MTGSYDGYRHFLFDRPADGVLLITMNRPDVRNAMNHEMHAELARLWPDIATDQATRVVVVTGAGDHFSFGGEGGTIEEGRTFAYANQVVAEMTSLVWGMTNLDKPIISAINGPAVAGGVAVALLADISIMAEDTWFSDGHTRGGLVAGDHAVLLWPLLTSFTKAKYYLMTGDKIDGREAERIGLVTFAVPVEQVVPRALAIAEKLAVGSQTAIRWTKRTLNHWLRQAGPAFESSMALEVLSFFGDDAAAWTQAARDGVRPSFPSARTPDD